MKLLYSLTTFLCFYVLVGLFFPANVRAICTGDEEVISSNCDQYCSTTWYKTHSWYDCPPGSPINPENNKPECAVQDRVFVCSYPMWHANSSCTSPKADNNCGSTYCSKDANPNNLCGPNGTDPCRCGAGGVCVDQNYTPTQLCTGQFQQSTHGGCVAASCGYWCIYGSLGPSGQCAQQYADAGWNQGYSTEGLEACQANCTPPPPGQCGDACKGDRDCESGKVCYSGGNPGLGVCRNPSCLTDTDCSCPVTPCNASTTRSCGQSCDANRCCNSSAGLTCYDGECRLATNPTSESCQPPPVTPGQCGASCDQNRPCSSSLSCTDGECRNPLCSTDSDCICPSACGAQGQACCAGNTCSASNLSCQSGVCVNPTGTQQPPACNVDCSNNAFCAPIGLICYQGHCRHPGNPGSSSCTCPDCTGSILVTIYKDLNGDGVREGTLERASVWVYFSPGEREEITGERGNNNGQAHFSYQEVGGQPNVDLYIPDQTVGTTAYRFVSADGALNRSANGLGKYLGTVNANYSFTVHAQSATPLPSCTVSVSPNPLSINQGSNQILTATVTPGTGTIEQVEFSSRNAGIISVNPASDASSPYQTTATAQSPGSTFIDANVRMSAPGWSSQIACTTAVSVSVNNVVGWWQAIDADVFAAGDLRSTIPSSCSGGSCTPRLILPGVGGYSGVPAFSGSANYGTGSVSASGWNANTSYTGRNYGYDWYRSLAATDTEVVNCPTGCNLNATDITAKAGDDKVNIVVYEGNVTITNNVNMNNKKIALFVNGNLNINGRIELNDGSGFFASFVKGNVAISPSVTHPSQPSVEGLLVSDGSFSTGAGSSRYYHRGSVVAWGGVSLQRDLGSQNNQNPAELFEYAPDLILSFPPQLFRDGVVWREIAP